MEGESQGEAAPFRESYFNRGFAIGWFVVFLSVVYRMKIDRELQI
jgi:hypothetical protein